MQIHQASTDAEVEAVRALFQEYAAWLRIDLCFQGFPQELAGLPGVYAPPRGRLLIARSDREAAGCVGLRALGETVCEMKRLFVRPSYQGRGVGRRLAEAVIREAQTIGYSRMVLDTLPSMHGSIALYESLGFLRCPAYYDTPLPETIFMELRFP
jgi:GNAT superfamily N-acetyltransferase